MSAARGRLRHQEAMRLSWTTPTLEVLSTLDQPRGAAVLDFRKPTTNLGTAVYNYTQQRAAPDCGVDSVCAGSGARGVMGGEFRPAARWLRGELNVQEGGTKLNRDRCNRSCGLAQKINALCFAANRALVLEL